MGQVVQHLSGAASSSLHWIHMREASWCVWTFVHRAPVTTSERGWGMEVGNPRLAEGGGTGSTDCTTGRHTRVSKCAALGHPWHRNMCESAHVAVRCERVVR